MSPIWMDNATKQWGLGDSVQLLQPEKNRKQVVEIWSKLMPLKVTAAALAVLVHNISHFHCHLLKSQFTFILVDLSALILYLFVNGLRGNLITWFFKCFFWFLNTREIVCGAVRSLHLETVHHEGWRVVNCPLAVMQSEFAGFRLKWTVLCG